MGLFKQLALILSLLVLLVSACQSRATDAPIFQPPDTPATTQFEVVLSTEEQAISKWLAENAVDLVTDDFTADLEPLAGLADIVGDSRILALGEQTHGTHEFFTVRQRLIRYAIEELDFTVLEVEAPWAPGRTLNEYIHGADVDLRQALIEMEYWTFATEENLDFFEWLREYNSSHPEEEQVSFYGFDIADPSESAERFLLALANHSPELHSAAEEAFLCLPLDYASTTDFYYLGSDAISSCLNDIGDIREQLDSQSEALIADLGLSTFEAMEQELRVITQFLNQSVAWLEEGTIFSRENSMVENILWTLEHSPEDSKVILWAHNQHILERSPQMLGGQLSEIFGDDYFSIGASFYSGSFLGRYSAPETAPWEDPGPHTIVESAIPFDFSFEHFFNLAPMDYFVLPLAAADTSTAAWLLDSRPFRAVGSIVGEPDEPDRNFYTHNLLEDFDAIYFSRYSTPSNPLIIYE